MERGRESFTELIPFMFEPKEFMIGLLGDTDTKDEILVGFRLINKGEDVATVERLGKVVIDCRHTHLCFYQALAAGYCLSSVV